MKNYRLLLMILIAASFSSNGFSQQRKVLIEQFTNSGCPPCAGNTPIIASYANANPSTTLMLAYHTSFPYLDSMYHENPLQSDQRVSYYNVVGVPTSRVDGNYFSGNLVPVINNIIPGRANIAPRYNINFISSTLNNSLLNVSVVFESADPNNQSESLTGQIVVTEKKVLKSSYVCCAGANVETEYPWVVRKMLPDQSGTNLINTNLGGTDTINLSWTANNIKDFAELRVIAFVQNINTKEIYQAEISIPGITTGSIQNMDNDKLFSVANPIMNGLITVHFNRKVIDSKIKVIDIIGNVIFEQIVSVDKGEEHIIKDIKKGIYFLVIESGNNKEIKKIISN